MCIIVYLASNKQLKTMPWNPAHPSLNVSLLDNENIENQQVNLKLKKKYLYFVGSLQHCGCGFESGRYDKVEEDEQYQISLDSNTQLKEYLLEAYKIDPNFVLYACWDGDQHKAIASKQKIKLSEIDPQHFWFQALELLEVF